MESVYQPRELCAGWVPVHPQSLPAVTALLSSPYLFLVQFLMVRLSSQYPLQPLPWFNPEVGGDEEDIYSLRSGQF